MIRTPLRLSRAQCRRIDEAIMDAKIGDFDWEDVCRVAAEELPNADDDTIEAIVKSRWDR